MTWTSKQPWTEEDGRMIVVCSMSQAIEIGLGEKYILSLPPSDMVCGAVVHRNDAGEAHIYVPWAVDNPIDCEDD